MVVVRNIKKMNTDIFLIWLNYVFVSLYTKFSHLKIRRLFRSLCCHEALQMLPHVVTYSLWVKYVEGTTYF